MDPGPGVDPNVDPNEVEFMEVEEDVDVEGGDEDQALDAAQVLAEAAEALDDFDALAQAQARDEAERRRAMQQRLYELRQNRSARGGRAPAPDLNFDEEEEIQRILDNENLTPRSRLEFLWSDAVPAEVWENAEEHKNEDAWFDDRFVGESKVEDTESKDS